MNGRLGIACRYLPLAVAVAGWLSGCGDDGTSPADGADLAADVAGDADGAPDTAADADAEADDDADAGADADVPPPPDECIPPIALVDTSAATNVVGTGTPESCTEAALRSALEARGRIRFDCGPAPVTIAVTSELRLDGYTGDVVLDGGGLVTLDGGGRTRILGLHSSFERPEPRLTVQRLAFANGRTTDVPHTSSTDNGGAAIYRLGGSLDVIDCVFQGNVGPENGQDVAGGAVYSIGVGTTTIVGSTFRGNRCSSGGAIGNLHNSLVLVNSAVESNAATGTGGNPGDGGNGGGIYMDGVGNALTLCGCRVAGNTGNAFGGGVFRVSNAERPPTDIDRSTFENNELLPDDFGLGGGLYLQGNAITIDATTLSGNRARGAGGLFIGPNSSAELTNVTLDANVAKSGLGGGLFTDDATTGTLLNCTLTRNAAPGDVAFAGAIAGGGGMTMRNTVVAYSVAGNGWNPISCTRTLADGGGNFQWPVARAGGGSDDPDALCASGASLVDPLLGELADNGGPTRTALPADGSPVLGAGTACPPTDQRGEPRSRCDSGAVER
ncbi:MAG: hypothetical protein HY907_12115 [Deltaproteobacteria bacterium]|nr:hypothetical protein [Deltaproteobacteria bacterium]